MDKCLFLELPVELRLRIYEYLLRFNLPVKLRQVIPGSRDLAILRTNKQVHAEALPVLYDLNTVVATRNDFCIATDASLKTPIKPERVRHLVVVSFSQSIACMIAGRGGECEVCRPDAMGFVKALAEMPRLRTVRVDYSNHTAEIKRLSDAMDRGGEMTLVPVERNMRFVGYDLVGKLLDGIDVHFRRGRLHWKLSNG